MSEPITVLLVDDDPDCRMLVRDAIEQAGRGHRVHEVACGQDAMDFLLRRRQWSDAPRPDLICLDIEMPGMDGQEVLARIKQHPALREIPVIMMTGLDDDEQKRLAARSGANSYALKPAAPGAFWQTVQTTVTYWLGVHQYPAARPA